MKESIGSKKSVLKRSAVFALSAVLAISGVISSQAAAIGKNEAYRSISVYKLTGSADVDRENIGKLFAYVNMQLISKDKVSTAKQTELYLKLDDDKYIMAESDTQFNIIAEGTKKNSKTKIELKKGSIVNRIDNKLEEGASYEVSTPNSTMAVRGTKFKISVDLDADGSSHTVLSVYDGNVETRLVSPNGVVGEPVFIGPGKQVRIGGNANNSYFELDPNKSGNVSDVSNIKDSNSYIEKISEGASLGVLGRSEVEFLMDNKGNNSNTGNLLITIDPSSNSGSDSGSGSSGSSSHRETKTDTGSGSQNSNSGSGSGNNSGSNTGSNNDSDSDADNNADAGDSSQTPDTFNP
ncbi:MAG: FecR family protein [Eubacteriales bacterium]|nr:FecR family protein [Eubacteriales bacterium]